ncbi:MAG: alpha-hydroxy-acid oxidizing protein, partial [Chloroflexota bacterium]
MPYLNLNDLEPLAREALPAPIFDFIAGGAEDEVTLRMNRAAFEAVTFRPRVLVDVSKVDTSTTVLGQALPLREGDRHAAWDQLPRLKVVRDRLGERPTERADDRPQAGDRCLGQ